jgi:hypothetical protein
VNPREVKRYINAYTILTRIHTDLDRAVLLALQTVDFRHDWDQVDDALLAYADAFLDALRRQSSEPTALEDLDPQLVSLPDDFRQYVSPGQPGARLLATHDIERYLFNAQAAKSAQDPGLLRAIRVLGELRRKLRDAARTRPPSGDFLREIHKLVSQARSTTPPPTTSTLAALAQQDLERIASEVETQVSATGKGATGGAVDWGRVGPLVEAWEGLAQSVAKRLLRLNRVGNVQGGGPDIGQSSAVA